MSTHTERMKEHLLAQFDGKPVIAAILEALGEELDLLADAFEDLKEKRWIDTGEGAQLDGIGEIVGRSRQLKKAIQLEFFGFYGVAGAATFGVGRFRKSGETWLSSVNLADYEYSKLLWQKVYKNTSRATVEETIKSMLYIFNAPIVYIEETGNANIAYSVGRTLVHNDILMADALDILIRMGGVGCVRRSAFAYKETFAFLSQPNARGFGDGVLSEGF